MVDNDVNADFVRRLRAAVDRRHRMLTPGGSRVWPDKKLVEEGAVRDLLAGLHQHGERLLSDVRPRPETKPQTPPDVLATNETGGLVGIEVVELVDQELIETNLPLSKARFQAMDAATTHKERLAVDHPEKVRVWSGREVLDEAARLIAEKDAKPFVEDGTPYAERWLVMCTAEPFVAWGDFSRELPGRTFTASQFDRIYLVRDYDPVSRRHPWWRIFQRGTGNPSGPITSLARSRSPRR